MARAAAKAAPSSSSSSSCVPAVSRRRPPPLRAPPRRRAAAAAAAPVRAATDDEPRPPAPQPAGAPPPSSNSSGGGAALAGGAAAAGVAIFLAARALSGGAGASLAALEEASLDLDAALRNGRPTLVEFYAPWCEECRASVPTVASLERRFASRVNFVMLDVDNPLWQQEVEEFDVRGVPTFVFLNERGGALAAAVGRVPGGVLEANVAAMAEAEALPFLAERAPASALPSAAAAAAGGGSQQQQQPGGAGALSVEAPRAHA
jgi:thiol-disulfide isomerase/thioredoxin